MYNAILSVSFSDQPVGSATSGVSVYSSDTLEESYTIDEPNFLGAEILLVFRDGVQWTLINGVYSPGIRQCKLTDSILEFNTTLAPLQIGENVTVLYESASGSINISEPILLEDAKTYLRTSSSADDALITELITAARAACERYVGISFVPRTIRATLTNELGRIPLPYGPIIAVQSVKDEDDNEIDFSYKKGLLVTPCLANIEVLYTAGYSVLPLDLKTAIYRQLAHLWRNRGDVNADTSLEASAMEILYKYKSW